MQNAVFCQVRSPLLYNEPSPTCHYIPSSSAKDVDDTAEDILVQTNITVLIKSELKYQKLHAKIELN